MTKSFILFEICRNNNYTKADGVLRSLWRASQQVRKENMI